MSNNQLLIIMGLGILCWGLWEFFSKKAYVRVDWGWEYKLISKTDRPGRYWSSCIGKTFIGFFMIAISLYRHFSGS